MTFWGHLGKPNIDWVSGNNKVTLLILLNTRVVFLVRDDRVWGWAQKTRMTKG